MFRIRVHTLDLVASEAGSSQKTSNPRIEQCKGVVHLYRNVCRNIESSSSHAATLIFVVAVPSRFSNDDFRHFCLPFLSCITLFRFIRNDGIDDRYSVVLSFDDRDAADRFYSNFNGRQFSSFEAEVCHLLFVMGAEYIGFSDIAGTPPMGFTELPTCPVCLERLDQDTSGIVTTSCDHSFHCSCISKWMDSSCPVCKFCMKHTEKLTCSICQTSEDVWICLICGFVGCGRYKEGHAIRHWEDTQHCYSLDFRVQMVWDYLGDHFVHRLNQSKSNGKLVKSNYRCHFADKDSGNCECQENSAVSGAVFKSKVDAVVDEYTRLLVSQLESQRQMYESLLMEAKCGREKVIADAVEKALSSRVQEVEAELERNVEAKRHLEEVNEKLMKDQDCWRKEVMEIEEREQFTLKQRDDRILDLEEQIRDLTIYLEAQKTLDKMADADEIRQGTIIPVQCSSSAVKKSSKTRRRPS